MLQLGRNGILIPRQFLFGERFLHLFSTSSTTAEKTPNSVVNYLVGSLGFSREEAIATSLKVSCQTSSRNPNSVVDFFKQNSFSDTHIKKLVSRDPHLLSCDVEKTLKPKIRILQGLGLSGSDLGEFVANCQPQLFRTLRTAVVDNLTSVFGTKENVLKILKKSRWNISVNDATRNVTVLRNHGVSSERILKIVVRYTNLLHLDAKKLEDICARIKEQFGISVESSSFLSMIAILGGFREKNLDMKYQVLKSYGWTESDIGTMIRKFPDWLKLSEVMLQRKLEYFMKGLCFKAGYIASHPGFLTYSLEKRVVPRNAVLQLLKENKLIRASFPLYQAVSMGEPQFLKNLVLPNKDKFPGLIEAYKNNKMDSFIRSC